MASRRLGCTRRVRAHRHDWFDHDGLVRFDDECGAGEFVAGLEVGSRVTVWGRIESIDWEKAGKPMPPYSRIAIERVQSPDWTLPAPAGATETPETHPEAESIPMLPLDDEERALIGGGLP